MAPDSGRLNITPVKTAWGWAVTVAKQDGIVIGFFLPEPDKPAVIQKVIAAFGRNLASVANHRVTVPVKQYFEGTGPVSFDDVKIDLSALTPHARSALETVRKIPYGQTRTYAEIAAQIGNPDSARAVGNALAQNPVPLIVPCHRVIRADGDTGGFTASGGPGMKQKMLALEKSATAIAEN